MRLIRCPYCGAEFSKHKVEYVGADPQMQMTVGLFFMFFAINGWLVLTYFEEWFNLLMLCQLVLGLAIVGRGAYKYIRGRMEFWSDIPHHLRRHHRAHRTRHHLQSATLQAHSGANAQDF